MGQNLKFVLVGLLGVMLVLGFFLFQTFTAKEMIAKELEDAKKENASLEGKLRRVEQQLSTAQDKTRSLGVQLDQIAKEKQELQKKFELAKRAKDELAEKLKSQQKETVQQAEKIDAPRATEDSYWADVLKTKTDLQIKLSEISNELKSLRILNEELQRGKATMELEISNLKRERDDTERQLAYNKKLMDAIAQELVRERNDKIQIQDSFKLVKNENQVLIRQINGLNSRKIALEKKIQSLLEDKDSIVRKYDELEGMLAEKVTQVTELQQDLSSLASDDPMTLASAPRASSGQNAFYTQRSGGVELQPILVRGDSADASSRAASVMNEGKILAVNTDNNFIVIDIGEDQGVQLGDVFQVYRGGEPIGAIEAIQLRKTIAACDIRQQAVPLKIGDIVR